MKYTFFFILLSACSFKAKKETISYSYKTDTCISSSLKPKKFHTTSEKIKELVFAFLSNSQSIEINKQQLFLFRKRNSFTAYIVKIDSTVTKIDSINLKIINSKIFTNGSQIFEYDTSQGVLYDFNTNKSVSIPGISKFSNLYSDDIKNPRLIKIGNNYEFLYDYSLWKSENKNYFDTTIFFRIAEKNKITKFGEYPNEYYKRLNRFNDTYYDIDFTNNIYLIYSGFDSIYKIDLSGNIMARNVLHKFPKRDEFNLKMARDLVELRKYDYMNEDNLDIKLIGSKYIFVLKQLAADSVFGKMNYKLFKYDTNLNLLGCSIITEEDVYPHIYESELGACLITGIKTKKYKVLFYEVD